MCAHVFCDGQFPEETHADASDVLTFGTHDCLALAGSVAWRKSDEKHFLFLSNYRGCLFLRRRQLHARCPSVSQHLKLKTKFGVG